MGLVDKRVGWVILVVSLCSTRLEASEEGEQGSELPRNCWKVECAPYEVIETRNEFEIRTYRDAMWVSTVPFNSTCYKDAATKGFDILLSYIQGNNNEAANMSMTAPVLVNILTSTGGSFCNSSFVVHFYIHIEYQKSPPLSAQAHPVKLPKYKYAAMRRFGGFMDDSNSPTQALALKKSLMGTINQSSILNQTGGEGIVPLSYSVAGYNSPFEF